MIVHARCMLQEQVLRLQTPRLNVPSATCPAKKGQLLLTKSYLGTGIGCESWKAPHLIPVRSFKLAGVSWYPGSGSAALKVVSGRVPKHRGRGKPAVRGHIPSTHLPAGGSASACPATELAARERAVVARASDNTDRTTRVSIDRLLIESGAYSLMERSGLYA